MRGRAELTFEQAKAFAGSKQAYSAGDGGRAHDLSIEGKEHQRLKDQYNDQAANWIFNGALVTTASLGFHC